MIPIWFRPHPFIPIPGNLFLFAACNCFSAHLKFASQQSNPKNTHNENETLWPSLRHLTYFIDLKYGIPPSGAMQAANYIHLPVRWPDHESGMTDHLISMPPRSVFAICNHIHFSQSPRDAADIAPKRMHRHLPYSHVRPTMRERNRATTSSYFFFQIAITHNEL